jgi:hypothetical protein
LLRFAFCIVRRAAAGSLMKESMNREKELCDARCEDGRTRSRKKERQEKPNGSEELVSFVREENQKKNSKLANGRLATDLRLDSTLRT